MQLPRLLRAVADAFEDVLPRAAVAHALGRAEDPFEVDGAVRRRLGRVVDDHLAVVLFAPQRVRREDPDLDEVAEVREAIQLLQSLDRVGRQRVVVAARDLEQRVRAHGPLEVDVQLDLRVRIRCRRLHRTEGSCACARANRSSGGRPARRGGVRAVAVRSRRRRRGTGRRRRRRSTGRPPVVPDDPVARVVLRVVERAGSRIGGTRPQSGRVRADRAEPSSRAEEQRAEAAHRDAADARSSSRACGRAPPESPRRRPWSPTCRRRGRASSCGRRRRGGARSARVRRARASSSKNGWLSELRWVRATAVQEDEEPTAHGGAARRASRARSRAVSRLYEREVDEPSRRGSSGTRSRSRARAG